MKLTSSDMTQGKLEKLSLAQRMLAAKKRRQEQVNQYQIREKKEDKGAHNGYNPSKKRTNSTAKVSFDPTALLFEAVIRNDLNEVRQLLKSGLCDKDVTNSYGFTPLHQSCIDQNLSMVSLLVKEFAADVNKCDLEKWTPLHTLALFGFADITKFLLNHGADVLALNIDMNMPYDMCDEEATLHVIESHMASKGVTQEKIEVTRRVAERKMLKELQHHLSSGRLNSRNFNGSNGESLLHIASANGYYEVASMLINKAKHPVSCFDNDLWQPIHAAAYWQQGDVAELLLSNGADIYVKNNDGENAIDLCRDKEFSEWMIQTYNNNNSSKKSSKAYKNAMKNQMKKSGASKHHFNSSVSLNDLNNLSSKRLNTERKEKKQKKDKENEYQWMISSRDDLDEEEAEDDEFNINDLNNNRSRMRKNSHQVPSPTLEKQLMINGGRKLSEVSAISSRSRNSSQQSNDSDKGNKKNRKFSMQTSINEMKHLEVPVNSYGESPKLREHGLGWEAAVRQMDEKRKNSDSKNSDRKNSDAKLSERKSSDQSNISKEERLHKNTRIKLKNTHSSNLDENDISNLENSVKMKQKRSASLGAMKHNSVEQFANKQTISQPKARKSIVENNYKKSQKKGCIIS